MSESHTNSWQIWVDRGGTFTDLLAVSERGDLHALKLLSNDPQHYQDAVVEGVVRLINQLGITRVSTIKVGTTLATNALLERTGAKVGFITNQGFEDLLVIRSQHRDHLFNQAIVKAAPLYQDVYGVTARVDVQGERLAKLDKQALLTKLETWKQQGITAIAVALIHAHLSPADEFAIADLATEMGFAHVSLSHQTSAAKRLLARAETTVANAYLTPIIQNYSRGLINAFTALSATQHASIRFMQSNGDLIDAAHYSGKDAVLSGPAGGIVAMAKTAELNGFDRVVGFDMGGTSTDVSLYAGSFDKSNQHQVAGVSLEVPMLAVNTVAAGGGSKLWFDGERLRVGPASTGSHPGPVCYRKQGELAVTDINVVLGRIHPDHFPRVFGANADSPLDGSATIEAFDQLTAQVNQALDKPLSREQLATGFLTIAVTNMANAIRSVSTKKGIELDDFVMNAFGGAGGQHACLVADELGIDRILIHQQSSLLSAFGIGCAADGIEQTIAIAKVFNAKSAGELSSIIEPIKKQQLTHLEQAASDSVTQDAAPATEVNLHLAYAGSDHSLRVLLDDYQSMLEAFEQQHQQAFGFIHPERIIEIIELSVETTRSHSVVNQAPTFEQTPQRQTHAVFFNDTWHDTDFIHLSELLLPTSGNNSVVGPAVVYDQNTTVVVEIGWQMEASESGDLLLSRITQKPRRLQNQTELDPVRLEVFNSLFMHIAEQMGSVLQQTAHSVNIKERLDFSCALFDRNGALIANAPHMPVHLGSMSDSVAQVIRQTSFLSDNRVVTDNVQQGAVTQGDVFMLNSPYHGGTHLPDITLVSPVFIDEKLLYWVASRGHHADIGGITPGSMPADSQSIEQEGVLFEHFKLVKQHQLQTTELRQRLLDHPFPARNVEQTLADLTAQIAANQRGIRLLKQAAEQFGTATVTSYMAHVQNNAEHAIERVVPKLKSGKFSYPMDNGAVIALTIEPTEKGITLDFSGTSRQQANNFNAPLSVTRAAVLYVLRSLVQDDIPLNQGCLRPITLKVPPGCFLNPEYPAAVVAGNVETSQCVTDTLFGALGFQAAAQGTMNNFIFGNDSLQYYETIAGGSGAGMTLEGEGFNGADAVQTHMTNSRITDAELLERRFPVILEQFAVRQNSGGAGQWYGGNGAVRRIRFLTPMTVSILSNNRTHAPFGQGGGSNGLPGINRLIRSDGIEEILAASCEQHVSAGDVIEILTPGGGGFGEYSKDGADDNEKL